MCSWFSTLLGYLSHVNISSPVFGLYLQLPLARQDNLQGSVPLAFWTLFSQKLMYRKAVPIFLKAIAHVWNMEVGTSC